MGALAGRSGGMERRKEKLREIYGEPDENSEEAIAASLGTSVRLYMRTYMSTG